MDDLDRMLRRLVQALRTGFPEYLTRPFEVGELYQRVIPYRHNRRELGLDTNGDYELLLTRLLSGERGYLVGDQQLQEAMRQELASTNPDTSAFRGWADARVRITEEALRQADIPGASMDDVRLSPRAPAAPELAASPPPPAAAPLVAPPMAAPPKQAPAAETSSFRPSAVPVAPPAPARPAPAAPPRAAAPPSRPFVPTPPFPAPAPAPMSPSTRSVSSSALGGSCRYCGGTLPEGRRYTFCPHCGQNLTVQHCPACSTELEIGWKFCTTCGRAVGDA
jgi:hypothetical protein